MRILIFGDVHGNLLALEHLLKIEKNSYDLIISHGDIVGYGPWADECVSLLSQQNNIILLKGNHEEAFIEKRYTGDNPIAKAFFDFCLPRFYSFDSIKEYGESYDTGTFLVRHTILNMYVFENTELSNKIINRNIIIGHSHYQFSRYVNNYNIVNTGSLGQNRKNINVAEYLIFDSSINKIYLKSFVFDVDILINEMFSKGYPSLCVNYYQSKNRV